MCVCVCVCVKCGIGVSEAVCGKCEMSAATGVRSGCVVIKWRHHGCFVQLVGWQVGAVTAADVVQTFVLFGANQNLGDVLCSCNEACLGAFHSIFMAA